MRPSRTTDPRAMVIDRDTHTIRFERHTEADRAQVFDAWTQPEQVTVWWDPSGEALAACEIDLRVGGAFAFTSRGHPDMPFAGVYTSIIAPERLEFESMGSVGRVVLSPADEGTHMVVEIACPSAEHLEQFMKMGVHQGTSVTLDNLVDFLRTSRSVA